MLNVHLKQTLSRLFKPFNSSIQLKTDDLEKLNELVSLQNQVKPFRLQDKLGKQNFHEDTKKSIWTRHKNNLKMPLKM